jgi:hypothetical protein
MSQLSATARAREVSAVKFLGTAISDHAPLLDRREARRKIFRRVLLALGVLCLVVFGIIGAIVGNGATSSERDPTPNIIIRHADWHGVPQHPDADLLRTISDDSGQFIVIGDAAAVSDWFEQTWTGFGLRYAETSMRNGVTFRFFQTSGTLDDSIFGYRLFGYSVAQTSSGSCTITLIRVN